MSKTGSKKVLEAWERIPEEDRKGQRGAEELVAYLVENNPELSVLQRIISAIKTWLADSLPGVLLNEKDIVGLAHAALRREGKNALAEASGDMIGGKHGRVRQGQISKGDMGRDRAERPSTGGGALALQDPLPVSRSTVATSRSARTADFLSDEFKLWFGQS